MRRDAPTSAPGGDTRSPGAHKSSGHDELTSHAAGATAAHMHGDAGSDQLTSGSNDDLLMGGASADALTGGKGNDILVGGIDSYLYKIGDGNDTIIDSDKKGRIAKVSRGGTPSNEAWRMAA